MKRKKDVLKQWIWAPHIMCAAVKKSVSVREQKRTNDARLRENKNDPSLIRFKKFPLIIFVCFFLSLRMLLLLFDWSTVVDVHVWVKHRLAHLKVFATHVSFFESSKMRFFYLVSYTRLLARASSLSLSSIELSPLLMLMLQKMSLLRRMVKKERENGDALEWNEMCEEDSSARFHSKFKCVNDKTEKERQRGSKSHGHKYTRIRIRSRTHNESKKRKKTRPRTGMC